MFGHHPHLPIDFYFPTVRYMKKHQHVDHYVAELCEWLQEAFKEAQMQFTSETERQKRYHNRKTNAISLEPGDLVLAKADTYGGRRKAKDPWEEEPYEVEQQILEGVPSYLMKNQWTRCSWVLHQNWLFLIAPVEGTHLYTVMQAKCTRCTTATLEEQTQKSKTEEVPQSVSCLLLTQHQTSETPLRKVNRKLCAFILTLSRASTLDQGWKDWCRGIEGVWESTSVFWQQKYSSHWWSSKIQLAMITTSPPLFDLEIASS